MNHDTYQPGENVQLRRFLELDVLRGFAIIFMILLHILWDLDYFNILPLNENIYSLNIIVPIMFFLLVGICQAVNSNKYRNEPRAMYFKSLQRGLWIINLGMLFTVLTVVAFPDRPILFGVLHCIGFSVLISAPFLRFKSYNLLFASILIIAGVALATFYTVDTPTMLQLAIGIHQSDIATHTIDYFPLLPWFGVCLLGIALGNILYKDNKRRFPVPNLSNYTPAKIFSWIGRHSLAIYVFHQPIIAGVLFLVLRI